MSITIDAIFDGEVLRPQQPLELTPNQHYSITIEDAPESGTVNAWRFLESIAGSYDGPGDSAAEHDHYIYGTPKRGANKDA